MGRCACFPSCGSGGDGSIRALLRGELVDEEPQSQCRCYIRYAVNKVIALRCETEVTDSQAVCFTTTGSPSLTTTPSSSAYLEVSIKRFPFSPCRHSHVGIIALGCLSQIVWDRGTCYPMAAYGSLRAN